MEHQEQEVPLVQASIDVDIQPSGEIMLHVWSEVNGVPDSHMAFSPKMAYQIGQHLMRAAQESARRMNKNAN